VFHARQALIIRITRSRTSVKTRRNGKRQRDLESIFDERYRRIYQDRWDALKTALKCPSGSIALKTGLLMPYYLDEASLWAADLVPCGPGSRILDMCSAPGGKLLGILSRSSVQNTIMNRDTHKGDAHIDGTSVTGVDVSQDLWFVANERSAARRARLKAVVKTHLAPEIAEHILVTSHDARRWGVYEKNQYTAVLLDAPCSSERHLLKQPHIPPSWGPGRARTLSIQAYAMLAAALDAVVPGGTVVYCTCSISPEENDGVLEKAVKKRGSEFSIERERAFTCESTLYGALVMPDIHAGRGPLYTAVVRKNR
jgi:5-methylcytosine rRNA methyltransferase NSUN4